MLRAFGHHVATYCDVLRHVGSNLKMVKFSTHHLWMLLDVVVVWPGLCNNVAPGLFLTRNMTEHVATWTTIFFVVE